MSITKEARTNGAVRSRVAVEVTRLSRRFGAIDALADVGLSLDRGSVHGLVGENGAGKSTLVGILAGRTRESAGRVTAFGEHLETGSPRSSRRAGIVAIYQELTIVPTMSARDNVFLGQALAKGPRLDERAMDRRFAQLCAELDVAIPAHALARELSIADQQMLEIMRALQAQARVLLLDEPTAALAPVEREALFRVLNALREQDVAMLYVSHNLDEVLALCDRVTVLRNGVVVDSRPAKRWSKDELVDAMLGAQLSAAVLAAPRRSSRSNQAPLLRARDVSVPRSLCSVSVDVHPGEVVGVAGLVGSGRTTLLRALAGLESRASGSLSLEGRDGSLPRSVRSALKLGVALIPEDRRTHGLLLNMPARDNVCISDLRGVATGPIISQRSLRDAAAEATKAYAFDASRLGTPAGLLSGGNQQKLLLARWRHRRPRVLLADEPTRGIDVGAKAEIFAALRAAADDGLGVIFVSSELDEVLAFSDRIVVLAAGRKTGEFTADNVDPTTVLRAAFDFGEPS